MKDTIIHNSLKGIHLEISSENSIKEKDIYSNMKNGIQLNNAHNNSVKKIKFIITNMKGIGFFTPIIIT